jgi:cellobiose phosphorylase
MKQSGELSNTAGAVLDPIAAIRCQITLKPGERIVFDLINGVTHDQNDCMRIIEKYQERHWVDRQFELAKILLQKRNLAKPL